MDYSPVCVYCAVVVFFHASEFVLAAVFMRDHLSFKSLLISGPYCVALVFSVFEFLLEDVLLQVHKPRVLSFVGFAIVCAGECIRKTAMVTAGANFTHSLRTQKQKEHKLVCHGIYSYVRHPGYLGWMVWVTGTQLVLVNPLCIVLFTLMSWNFLRQRIQVEEQLLCDFFNGDYEEYAQKVPSGIIFIP